MHRPTRKGFSLIEMVIVILILGIIAAVAAPRMFDTATTAEENTTRQQLQVLRNAIEMYRARDGVYPETNDLPRAMASMLNGPFPAPSVGSHRGDVEVYYDGDTDPATEVEPSVSSIGGWAYKPANGSLKLNVDSSEGDGQFINW
jgi:general secretion pathway protein G